MIGPEMNRFEEPKERSLRGLMNRSLQLLAMSLPGARKMRVMLHRIRGVNIGDNVFISQNVLLETAHPELITIEDGVFIGVRVTIIAHMRELGEGVTIEHDAFVGPGAIILPNVTVGYGTVVTAGSVVTRSIPPMTVVQGNPAIPIARCGIPLTAETTMKEFSLRLKPLPSGPQLRGKPI